MGLNKKVFKEHVTLLQTNAIAFKQYYLLHNFINNKCFDCNFKVEINPFKKKTWVD